MKSLFSILVLVSTLFAQAPERVRGAQLEDCAPYSIYDLSLCDLGPATLTDGQSQTTIDLAQPATYTAMLCYTPTGIWIAGQYAPAGPIATVISLPNGRQVIIEWVEHAVDIRDITMKECRASTEFPALPSVGRYFNSNRSKS